ncbi:MAG: aminoacyl-tRNA hydrolase [Candidatus Vogelbacteria bacterium CG10_big_fil_rev_8_21_14_0_10_50_13]|uniref:Peptidyl-tRNA hydrolase n=1 Tax=Candidatus Vogelbacteria bacterium CG10_big_fil_rev_8_21_14_0_10_50_13 TaxID=1975044 RepID=A0A2H0RG77_9BACT|nr:MAG: aminoacyl-tRNA hydrolase [Candidatus Vogelbacteria bacterium CG10_big_fil_rev_8_21_14_0_10_50_13]
MSFIIVGLGNPGQEYEETRHNAGRMAVELLSDDWSDDKKTRSLVSKAKIGKKPVALLLPETFMNKSGEALKPLVKSVKVAAELVVIHDDLDLPLGRVKMTFARGAGGHRGVESVKRAVKTDKFYQIKIGISPATPKGKIKKPQGEEKVQKFILSKFKPDELKILKKVNQKIAAGLELLLNKSPEAAMNELNTK